MWQQLFDSLKDKNFMIVAVAEESRGPEHARQWIEAAKPGYLCLVDPDHRVADLYGMVNVPQAVWIDEAGRIVRPPETAGSTDYFRGMDLKTRTLPPEAMAKRDAARNAYFDAVRDWVLTGKYALAQDQARAKLPAITAEVAEAHAQFKLGLWLHRHGRAADAKIHFAEAARLHPDSWNMWRQAADLEEVGKASSMEFWQRVLALGEKPYYPPPDLPGFAK